jgi:hypothetical protein
VKIPYEAGESLTLCFDDTTQGIPKETIIALLKRQEGTPVRSSQYATVLQFTPYQTGEQFYFKEFHCRGLRDRLKNFFGIIRSKRAFRAGKLLMRYGFHTPVPVLYGITKALCFTGKNFLITKGVPGIRTYAYLETQFPQPLPYDMVAEKRELFKAAGREIGRLHNTGICHGDLRVGNVLIHGRGGSAEFFFIDNERTRYCPKLPYRKRLKNLVQLNMILFPQVTSTDRLRFFNAYLEENPSFLSKKKELIREIQQRTQQRHAHKGPGVAK